MSSEAEIFTFPVEPAARNIAVKAENIFAEFIVSIPSFQPQTVGNLLFAPYSSEECKFRRGAYAIRRLPSYNLQ